MKPVKMFMMATCPYCRQAGKWMEEIFQEHPEYKNVDLTIIDENEQPAVANRYDYWFVPTYYVGDEKRHEGAATKEAIARVFADGYAG